MWSLSFWWAFLKVGLFAFGGGYAMVPLFEHELVGRLGWLSHRQFADAVVLSQVTPGPIATSAATITGYWRAGLAGAVAATVAVVLPAVVIVTLLARLIVRHREVDWLQAALRGVRPVVVGLVVVAALSLARTAPQDWRGWMLALLAGAAVGRFRLHPVAVLLGAGALGIILY